MIDLQARTQALDPEQSFIVQAPAGSGKTGLLVYRYLTLLGRVEKPQNVLAITFTRKARAEMRERIIELLSAAQAGQRSNDAFEQQGIELAIKVLERDQAGDWQLLAAPHQMQILTIDAFSAKLAASMPWLSRLGERPNTTDSADGHFAFAVDQVLDELLQDGSELAQPLQLVLHELDFNYDKARRLFTSMLAKRDQWLRHLVQQDMLQMKLDLEQAWADLLQDNLTKAHQSFSTATLEPLLEQAVAAAKRIDFTAAKSVKSLMCLVDFTVGVDVLQHQHWCALADFVLVQSKAAVRARLDKNIGFPAGKYDDKTRCTELFDQLRDDEDIVQCLAELSQLPTPVFSDYDWQRLVALESVLKALAVRLQLRFRSVGECDHSEVTQRANLALAELNKPTDLGLLMDGQIRHILVDEFQDTSNSQLDLLKKLTTGWQLHDSPARTLFLVGDPMQSIYRFREADVGLFLQVANNAVTGVFDNIDVKALQLSQNFRSSHTLVEWFNQTFTQSFPQTNDVLTGAITYAQAHAAKGDNSATPVSYFLANDRQQEAEAVLAAVTKSLAALPNPQAQIAVLVRSRSQLDHLLPMLDKNGIGYAAIDIQPLHQQQAVQDVIALCRAICREDDKLAWLALLRGPWCGLRLSEIHAFNRQASISLWQALQNTQIQSRLPPDSQHRIRRFIGIMRAAIKQYQQVDLGSLTQWAWQQLGGPHTLGSTQHDDIEQVFEVLNQCQRGGDLPSDKELNSALERLRAGNSQAEPPQVVVSTIHKSKGLQYHTVILPGLGSKARSDDREILMWAERQGRDGKASLLLAPLLFDSAASGPNSHYDYLRRLDAKRSVNEVMRLMYVACTRAEKHLVLIAQGKPKEQQNGEIIDINPPNKTSLLSTVWLALAHHFELMPSQPIEESGNSEISGDSLEQTLYRLPAGYQNQIGQDFVWQTLSQLNKPDAESNEAVIDFDWASEVAAAVGILLHDFLQYNSSNLFNVQINDALKRRWRAELLARRVPDNRIEYALQRLVKAVHHIQNDENARFIFADYAVMKNEYAISTLENGVVKKYRIDRTFIDDQGVRWVVDYKSTSTRREDVAGFVDSQIEERHRQQLEKYGELMRRIDSRPIKLAVYFPLLEQLRVWDYQATQVT